MVERIHGYCALCRSRCGCVSVVEDGRLRAVEPDPEHPTGRALCAKGRAAPQLVEHPERLLHPLRRRRPKGDADPGWERITWDEALAVTASRLCRLAEQHEVLERRRLADDRRVDRLAQHRRQREPVEVHRHRRRVLELDRLARAGPGLLGHRRPVGGLGLGDRPGEVVGQVDRGDAGEPERGLDPALVARPLLRRQRPNTISVGIQGSYGVVRGTSRLADGFSHGPGYAFRFRYMLTPSFALGFSFENHRYYDRGGAPSTVPGASDSVIVMTKSVAAKPSSTSTNALPRQRGRRSSSIEMLPWPFGLTAATRL